MNNEYVIINKKEMLKEIESLKESLAVSESNQDKIRAGIEYFEIKTLEWCLSRSTPLIPEIEKAFEVGRKLTVDAFEEEDFKDYEDYISNLKLDI
jgi:hypothetical protein